MYRENLAFIHHRGFGGFTRAVAPELLKLFRTHGVEGGSVVDLGCGDGTWLRALTRDGFAATGIEQSAAFVRLARRAAPAATVRHASLHRAALPRCDAITALGEVFNYLPAGAARPSLLPLFRRAHAALRPGGLLIFDLLVAGRPMNYETWASGRGWAVLVRVEEDRRRARLTRTIVAFRRRGARYERDDETHLLHVPTRAGVLADLRRAGFKARATRHHGAHALAPRRLAFVAQQVRRLRQPARGAKVRRRA